MTAGRPDLGELRDAVGAVCDPELPPLTLVDLGILRSVELERGEDGGDDTVVVTVTPTYSGCPAVEFIEAEIGRVLDDKGCPRYRIERSFTPAWSTDWMTDEGRRKLVELGIAPPGPAADPGGPVAVQLGSKPVRAAGPACPRCGSTDTEEVSRFGSTACKALHRCRSCAEPFDHFKAI